MVRILFLIFAFPLLLGSQAFALGEADILLQKELKSENAKTTIVAVREREIRLLEQFRALVKKKSRKEEFKVRDAFDRIANQLFDRGQARRAQMNENLQDFVLSNSGSPSVAQVYLRLAELYYEQANEKFAREMEAFEDLTSEHATDLSFEEPDMPEIDYGPAIELYQEFIEIFPNHPYTPEALYLLGYTLDENAQPDEAAEAYEKLIKIDPRGRLAPEAHFRLGEYLFLAAEFEDAEKEYRAVVKAKDPVFSDKAMYKLGWTQYLLEQYDASISTFIALIDINEADPDPGAQKLSMRKESLQYIAISFAEKGGLQALIKKMKKLGKRSYKLEIYAALGQVYFDLTQYREAADTYEEIIRRFPLNIQNPELQEKIIQIAGNLDGINGALKARLDYVIRFGPGSKWQDAFVNTKSSLIQFVNSKAEEFLYEYSTYFHARSQKAGIGKVKVGKLLNRAIAAYVDYRARFPESRRITDVTFNLAEIRYDKRQWLSAGELYRKLTQLIFDPQDPTFRDAAWNMVLSYRGRLRDYEKVHPVEEFVAALTAAVERRAFKAPKAQRAKLALKKRNSKKNHNKVMRAAGKVKKSLRGGKRGQVGDLGVLPVAVKENVNTALYYLQLYPLGKKAPAVLYSIGIQFFKYHQYEMARKYFLRYLTRFPEKSFALDAVKNIAASFVAESRYDHLVAWGKEMLKTALGRRKDVYGYFSGILSGAMFKDARKLEEQKKYIEANKVYVELRSTYPESEYIDESIQNAAINAQEAAKWDESNKLFKLFADRYPKTEFAPKALFQIANNHEKYMDFEGAIAAYEEVMKRYPKTGQAKDAHYNSANLSAKLMELEKAANLYLTYIKRYGNTKDIDEILFFAANSFFQLEEYNKAISNYRKYLKKAKDPKPNRIVQVYHELAESYEKLGKLKESDSWNRKLVAFTEKHLNDAEPVNSRYAAELAFGYAMDDYRKYDAIKLRGSSRRMSKTLKKKLDAVPEVNKKLLSIVKFRDPLFASAALHMIGESFMSLANMLFDAPVPSDLDEEEQEIYQEELESQAEPIEEKAMENWRKNLDNAVRLGIVNEWVVKSRKKLELVSSNLARIKHQEEYRVSSSEFFYSFGSSEEKHSSYTINGSKVVYSDLPAGSSAALQERYTFAGFFNAYHKRLMAGIALPDLSFDYNGMQVRMDQLLKAAK